MIKDGALSIKFEEGNIVRVTTNPRIDYVYESQFRRAYRSARKAKPKVEHGVRLVVFGAFWLEARMNRILREAILLEVRDAGFGIALWDALKRQKLADKIGILQAIAPRKLQSQYQKTRISLNQLLEMRNRLAHFKESDTEISGPLTSVEELEAVIGKSEDPPLIKELKRPSVLRYGRAVDSISRWLKNLENAQFKSKGVKSAILPAFKDETKSN